MEAKTTALAAVKQDVRLQEWSAQIEAQQASGLTVGLLRSSTGLLTMPPDTCLFQILGIL